MIRRKYLEELGCTKEYWPETGYNDYDSEEEFDTRLKRNIKKYETTGVSDIDTWNLEQTALMWLYERLVVYKKVAAARVDLTCHKFIYKDKEYTQLELINKLIDLGEYLIAMPDNLNKRTKAYKRVTTNPHYVKYNELYKADLTYSDKYGEEISGPVQAEEYTNECNYEFWNIWALVFPAMWW